MAVDPLLLRSFRPKRPPHQHATASRLLDSVCSFWMLAPAAVVAYAAWPGHMSNDSLVQVEQAASGTYTDQLAWPLIVLWHPLFNLGFGPGYVLTAQVTALVLGIYLLLRSTLRHRAAAVITPLILLVPPVLSMAIFLSRDTWCATALLIAVASAAHLVAETRQRHRRWLLAGFALGVGVVLASRQNGVLAALPVVCVTAMLTSRDKPLHYRLFRTASWALVTCVAWGALYLAMRPALNVKSIRPEQSLYVYDLAAMSHDTRRLLFPAAALPANLQQLDLLFVPGSPRALLWGPSAPLGYPLPSARVDELRAAWKEAIVDHPLLYARIRLDLWSRLNGVFTKPIWATHPGIDPNDMGLRIEHRAANRVMMNYLRVFSDAENRGSLPYRSTFWIALAIVLWATIGRRTRKLRRVALLASVSAVGYEASLLLAAPVAQYRLAFPVVLLGVVFVVLGAAEAQRVFTGRKRTGSALVKSSPSWPVGAGAAD